MDPETIAPWKCISHQPSTYHFEEKVSFHYQGDPISLVFSNTIPKNRSGMERNSEKVFTYEQV